MRYNPVYNAAKYGPHKRKSARKTTLETTKEFCDATSIHGFAYIPHDRNSAIDRVFWSIVVLLALSFTAYQVIILYEEWQNEPVITTLETVAEPIENIDFPAVTICPQGSRQEIIDSVLFRQLREYIRGREGDSTTLTPDLMMEHVDQFLKDTYPGTNGKPTQLVKLLSSDNPALTIKNDAILGTEQKCDPSSNQESMDSLNKQLNNDTCPDGFQMLGGMYCVHVTEVKLTYSDAFEYCNQHRGSEVLYLGSENDLIELFENDELGKKFQSNQYICTRVVLHDIKYIRRTSTLICISAKVFQSDSTILSTLTTTESSNGKIARFRIRCSSTFYF